MKSSLKAFFVLIIAVGVSVSAAAQTPQRNVNVLHRLQVRVLLPDGVAFPEVVRVQISSDRYGTPVDFRNLMRETLAEFTQIPNGEYILTVSTNNEDQIEPYTEKFSLRSNIPLTRQFNVFLLRKFGLAKKAVIGTISATGASDATEVPKAARKAFEKGHEKVEKGKSEEAIKAFQEAIKIHPTYLEAINDLAAQFIKAGKLEEAAAQLNQAIKLVPDSPLPHLNLGIVFNEQKRYQEAAEELSKAVKLDFDNALSHYQLGVACYNSSDLMRAQIEFEITTELAPRKYTLSRLYLADIFKRLGRTESAISQIEAFLRENSDNPYADVARKELARLKQENK